MRPRSDRRGGAAGGSPPRQTAAYIVIVEERIETHLAGRSPCLYISPPQLRTSALALVQLHIGYAPHDLDTGPWRIAVPGGEREIRLQRCLASGQARLDI